MKLISIVTPCLNEEDNVREIYTRIKSIFENLPDYNYEHIFIDNASTDKTIEILRQITKEDKNIKVILNTRDFGQVRSPMHAFMQAKGDAVIGICCDLQDPPELIPEFLKKWEEGFKMVLAVKNNTKDTLLMSFARKVFYKLMETMSDSNVKQVKNLTGFGLYDRQIVDIMKSIDDPCPYIRGLIGDIGFEPALIPFNKPARKKGLTKNNFYTLYDMAILGITSYSKVPLRIATLAGFTLSILSLLVAFCYFIAKILFWYSFPMGTAPIIISLFFFSSVQLFFIGVIGEYIGFIHTRQLKRPLVFEKERINFD
ncbi:MAG: dolichol monophosphate mannose synthase [Candidatus Melainabacteria bacterium GWA2_34_9]|nr:MAG: dolichol monophosphate mannose synthase [Candidatus Melainabacteria bacterium GWA2_34_9]